MDNFITIYNNENPEHVDLRRFLKTIRNFELVIDVSDLDELFSVIKSNPLLEELIDSKPPHVIFDKEILIKINIDSFLSSQPPFTLFFSDGQNVYSRTFRFGFETISTENLGDRWHCYRADRDDRNRKVTLKDNVPDNLKFDNWSVLKSFTHPVQSILIFDKYILSDKSTTRIIDNLIPLIKNLIYNGSVNKTVDITIISESTDLKKDFEKIKKMLTAEIKIPFILNLVKHHKSFYPRHFEGLHFRRVFTNYCCIKPDDSLNFFKPDGKVNNTADITILFSLHELNWTMICSDLQDIKEYITKVESLSQANGILETAIIREGKVTLID
ncbi:MAG: hypothetical protein KBC43_12825 [Bacteroidales bacterium]|nr:hypothetical protein [Bacteroidales bacterium]